MSIERAQRVQSILDAFTRLKNTSPTLIHHFLDMGKYHPKTGNHIESVAFTLTDSALSLHLDPDDATFTATGHDLGKGIVSLPALNGDPRLTKENIQILMREPHMRQTRTILKHQIPACEFQASSQSDAMAKILAHHDVLSNTDSNDYYPRHRRTNAQPKLERRRSIPPDILQWQVLLALQDKAHRFRNGYSEDRHKTKGEIIQELHAVLSQEKLALSPSLLNTMVIAVADSTCALRNENLDDVHAIFIK